MIEKLDIKDYKNKEQLLWFGVINKINELCDAVNELTSCVGQLGVEFTDPTPSDQYAEQRKWIGKLCRFWQCDIENAVYDILEEINENEEEPFCPRDWHPFGYCEPVKPDDDIVYKGNNNE